MANYQLIILGKKDNSVLELSRVYDSEIECFAMALDILESFSGYSFVFNIEKIEKI